MWSLPNDPVALAHIHLALTRLCAAISPPPRPSWREPRVGPNELGFPQGPFNHA